MRDHPRDAAPDTASHGMSSHGMPRLSHDDFAALVDRHQHRLHVYLAGMIGHAEQAFDLVQETFYEAWRAAQKGAPPFVPGAADADVLRWLFRAGSNNALSVLRRRKLIRWESLDGLRELREPLHGASEACDGSGAFEEHLAESDALQAALAQLTPQDVACLLLRVVHGFSAAEAGSILNTSADNINNRLARAKQRLRVAYTRPHGQSNQPKSRRREEQPR
jgi:RNA polymerase sigma-70 factor (ECF subfamily)